MTRTEFWEGALAVLTIAAIMAACLLTGPAYAGSITIQTPDTPEELVTAGTGAIALSALLGLGYWPLCVLSRRGFWLGR